MSFFVSCTSMSYLGDFCAKFIHAPLSYKPTSPSRYSFRPYVQHKPIVCFIEPPLGFLESCFVVDGRVRACTACVVSSAVSHRRPRTPSRYDIHRERPRTRWYDSAVSSRVSHRPMYAIAGMTCSMDGLYAGAGTTYAVNGSYDIADTTCVVDDHVRTRMTCAVDGPVHRRRYAVCRERPCTPSQIRHAP